MYSLIFIAMLSIETIPEVERFSVVFQQIATLSEKYHKECEEWVPREFDDRGGYRYQVETIDSPECRDLKHQWDQATFERNQIVMMWNRRRLQRMWYEIKKIDAKTESYESLNAKIRPYYQQLRYLRGSLTTYSVGISKSVMDNMKKEIGLIDQYLQNLSRVQKIYEYNPRVDHPEP